MNTPDFKACSEEELWRYVAWHLEGARIRSIIPFEGRIIRLLSPTDCVKDRLAAYIHWKRRSCYNQALLVCRRQKERVDLENVGRWCEKKGGSSVFRELVEQLSEPTSKP
ncbi:MAG: hypothetical protein V4584_11720 [Verrucomicrobiota bacterium]